MIGGKRATRGPQSFSCVVDSMKKIQTNLDRIRSSSRNSRPEVLGSPMRAESRTGAQTWRTWDANCAKGANPTEGIQPFIPPGHELESLVGKSGLASGLQRSVVPT